jgi:hypothetical protein
MMNTIPLTQRIKRAVGRRSEKVSGFLDHQLRIITSSLRILPNYLIIGTAKGGTTSLHRYLEEHPKVGHTLKKEVHFFDYNFKEGIDWYKTYFPLKQSNLIAGDSTPNYLIHPHTSRRVFETIPTVKLILLLRNPVDRAYSHHNMNFKRSDIPENLSFEKAIEAEEARLDGEMERMRRDENYISLDFSYYSYLASGIYIDQIKDWMMFFPRDQILILKSEDLFESPPTVYKQVLEFLNLPMHKLQEFKNANPRDYSSSMNPATRKYLIDFFRPHNQRLYNALGVDYDWDK